MESFRKGRPVKFGSNHYVPSLKVKRAEKAALRRLPPVLRSRITPLLEIVEWKAEKTFEGHLETAFKNLAESLKGYPRCFVDVREIEPVGSEAAAEVFNRAAAAGIAFGCGSSSSTTQGACASGM